MWQIKQGEGVNLESARHQSGAHTGLEPAQTAHPANTAQRKIRNLKVKSEPFGHLNPNEPPEICRNLELAISDWKLDRCLLK